MAAAKYLYEDYIKKYGKNILLVLMSDHGTYDFDYELELTNHGYQDAENSAFAMFMSPKFAGKSLHVAEPLHISKFAPFMCMFVENCNIPVLATHRAPPRFKDDPIEELITLRSREVQLLKYLEGHYDSALDANNNHFMKNFATASILSDKNYEQELTKALKDYGTYLSELEARVGPFEYKNH
jgi:hypothetical protein